ncbi:hypothetical protein BP5796_06760 [Coleophoma crateriformis]|uniref:N-acetyltransferase domain-containing protein n=1 Tax=Coleophoma crateriformis TaxID=565419 RepID=A0A3D8RPG2_9HELO|nr:hypothetical protein BP5796_06760 [Coleophoma crateriformis]
MASSYQVRLATRDEIPQVAVVVEEAFKDNEIFRYMTPTATPDQNYAWRRGMFEDEWTLPGRKLFVAVHNDTKQIVGAARWYFPYTLTEEENKAGVGIDVLEGPEPPGCIKELYQDFFTRLFAYRRKYTDHNDTYVLDILAIHPDHQRKGLGSLLIRNVLAQVDREGRRAYLEASAAGKGLYLKLGWEEIDEMHVDVRPYGGHGVEKEKIMMRPAVKATERE